jgi:HAD superfamily hydrolase (TIGR01509 family)
MRFADLDAVTVDGYGTLLVLEDPVLRLRDALAAHGVDREEEEVAKAFAAEVRHYRPRAHLGRDAASLAALRLDCVGVFLAGLEHPLPPSAFVEDFLTALSFSAVPGAVETLRLLHDLGLPLAVVANWDCALPEHLGRLGLDGFFSTVVTSAGAGVAKPDPAIFRLALRRLGVEAGRALHVGDEPADEDGALAAGMRFARAPLAHAFEHWS